MKLISFYRNARIVAGAAIGGFAVELQRAARLTGSGALPPTIRAILEGGPPAMARARKTVRRAEARLRAAARGRARRPVWAWPLDDVELAPPIPDPEKIICVGQNYRDHCREQGVEPPERPIIFAKFATTLAGPTSPIRLPPENVTSKVDYEIELAFVIGREAKRVPRARAMDCVAGYMVLNDVTARDAQFADGQWVRGKSFDTFAPCGPWLLTADEAPDPNDLRLWLELNGQRMQDSSTRNLIFRIPDLIEYITRAITLRPGDIVSTGTPPGVGIFRKPPALLKPGDVVEGRIEGIGAIRNRCVRDRG
jgi:2-keto-4-pentenoate hydratase/2-oxohepta-3-ene-1,7-dioic acid hydratase in catechol pathway